MAVDLGLDSEAMANEVEAKIRSAYYGSARPLNGSSAAAAARERFDPLYRAAMGVGQMPPQPSTLRGRIGAALIGVLRRALFWYSPQIVRFQVNAATEIERQYRLIEANTERISEQERALQSLASRQEAETARLRLDLAERDEMLRRLESEIARLKAPTAASAPTAATE